MRYINDVQLSDKRILLRVDYNVAFDRNHHILSDARIKESLPTIEYLLKQNNQLFLLSHLGRPFGHDPKLSLQPVAERLQEYLPDHQVKLITTLESLTMENTRTPHSNIVILLENIRFFAGENTNDPAFAKALAALGDVYVNDAFSVCHRKEASIVRLPKLLPSYGGLLLKKEVETISKALEHPTHPLVAVLGGAKISTKIKLIEKLITLSDVVLLGGGLANTFLLALGNQMGRSLAEPKELSHAQYLLSLAEKKQTRFLLPTDVIVGDQEGRHPVIKSVQSLTRQDKVFDLGPQTQSLYSHAISQGRTILWNGPMGMFEIPNYSTGTQTVFHAMADNDKATTIIGGGETLAALEHHPRLRSHITHVSTGGGAMLEFIEKGTLPGLDALTQSLSETA